MRFVRWRDGCLSFPPFFLVATALILLLAINKALNYCDFLFSMLVKTACSTTSSLLALRVFLFDMFARYLRLFPADIRKV